MRLLIKIELIVYFALHTLLIARPGIVQDYYHPGWFMIRTLFDYLGWFVVPSPAHSCFRSIASALLAPLYYIWRSLSYLAMFGFIPYSIWLYFKSPRQIRFFILFVFVSLFPAVPLDFKVVSRNIYIPCMGLAVMFGFSIERLLAYRRVGAGIRWIAAAALLAYCGISIAAVDLTSLQYHKTQKLVCGIVDDLKESGVNFNNYTYVLFDHVPGRAIIGPEMMYRLRYNHNVIGSNDPLSGPVDIKAEADSLYRAGEPVAVFDYRDGHMVETNWEYLNESP